MKRRTKEFLVLLHPSALIPHPCFPLLALLLLRKVFLSHAAKFRRRSERDFYGTRATVGRGHFSSRAERSQRESATLLQRPEDSTSKEYHGAQFPPADRSTIP